ncbi:MAG: glycosyltransferase family 39 protein [Bacteroidales bacterium]|nr:glycosyltransferase family 39 protein [Bacteroidales bacterium]MBN2818392.1 glycosyltransferase family 39 protein [Bacteroidales bacterium]
MIKQNKSFFLVAFVLTAIALRIFSFFPSVIDHDESTYLVMARDIFERGKTLYVDVTDPKPPGIFILFGLIQKITGTSIAFFRLFTALFVGLTAWFIYMFCMQWQGIKKVAVASGFIYIFFISTWKFFGMSSNTEHFFIFFNAIGLFFLVKRGQLNLFLAGLFFGFGFIIKYSNLFDFIPLVAFFVIYKGYQSEKLPKLLFKLVIIGSGFILPFASVNLYFYLSGNFESFKYITYYVPLNYTQSMNVLGVLDRLFDFHVLFLPIFFFFYYILVKKTAEIKPIKVFILVWIACVFWSILSLGNTFPHYFIQLMLPVSLLAGYFFMKPLQPKGCLKYVFNRKTGIILLSAFIIVKLVSDYNDYLQKPDYARLTADYINEHAGSEDLIYTGNYHQIIYLLTEKDSPTPYIHWTILYYDRLKRVMQIDNKLELDKIFTQNPKYVVVDGKLKEEWFENLRAHLNSDYQIETSFDDRIHIYCRQSAQ